MCCRTSVNVSTLSDDFLGNGEKRDIPIKKNLPNDILSTASTSSTSSLSSNNSTRRLIFHTYWSRHGRQQEPRTPSAIHIPVIKKTLSSHERSETLSQQIPSRHTLGRRGIFGASAFKRNPQISPPLQSIPPPISRSDLIMQMRVAKSTSSLLRAKIHKMSGLSRSVSFDPNVSVFEFHNNKEQWASEDWLTYFK